MSDQVAEVPTRIPETTDEWKELGSPRYCVEAVHSIEHLSLVLGLLSSHASLRLHTVTSLDNAIVIVAESK